jgi:dTDP-4-amino-4,6-dideoxygalactose transaminase
VVNDPDLLARAEIHRDKGTDRQQFMRGHIDRYRWMDVGSSYQLADVLAALLTAQLEAFTDIQTRRHRIWTAYHQGLSDWATEHQVIRPNVPADCAHPAHLCQLLLPDRTWRRDLQHHLTAQGITTATHYQPLHHAPAGLRHGRCAPGGCPVTENIAERLLRLPLYAGMDDSEVERVIDAVAAHRPRL